MSATEGPPQKKPTPDPGRDRARDQDRARDRDRDNDKDGDRSRPAKSGRTSSGSDPLRGSRTSGLWIGLVLISVLLILLIVFIAQNTDAVSIRFLGWEGDAPLAVALLVATVAGLMIATIAGSLRILQLRRRVKREAH